MTRFTHMSRASRRVFVVIAVIVSGDLIAAQQASTPRVSTPTPAPAEAPFHRPWTGPLPQGFSVVLVQGDLQTANATDDVPAAARKALADMRDFLPYKSYKLLDAAWILCCGGHSSPRSLGDVVTQLKGPEDREYELTLSASAMDAPRVNVRFFLRDVTGPPPGTKPPKDDEDGGVQEAKARIAELEAKLASVRREYTAQSPQVRRAEADLAAARRRLETAERGETGPMMAARRMAGRGVIDTNFAMDVGETVVVGTSRLRGGSRALIALLTAVPPKGMTERKE